MSIKYRKNIQEKYNEDFTETIERYGLKFRISEESRSASSDMVIISEHIDTLKYFMERCDFIGFENKMDNDINKTDKELEYLNRMDIFDGGNLFGLSKKILFALDKDENLYKFDTLSGFVPHDKVSKIKIRKMLKNKKGKNIRVGRETVRDPEYPFIVIDLSNGKYKFDREYFENVFLKSETKLVEKIARENLTEVKRDDKIGYIIEGMFYDLDFNIIKDLDKEREDRENKEKERLNNFIKEEGLSKKYFDKSEISDYQEAKQYLLRNGFNWSDLKRMNKHKIYFEANSLIAFKASEKDIELNPYKRDQRSFIERFNSM